MSFFNKIFDLIAWIKIFLSPFIIGLVIGAYLWLSNENNYLMQLLSLGVIAIGIAGGIALAERARKKHGTQEFMATIYRTPELDKEEGIK